MPTDRNKLKLDRLIAKNIYLSSYLVIFRCSVGFGRGNLANCYSIFYNTVEKY